MCYLRSITNNNSAEGDNKKRFLLKLTAVTVPLFHFQIVFKILTIVEIFSGQLHCSKNISNISYIFGTMNLLRIVDYDTLIMKFICYDVHNNIRIGIFQLAHHNS